MSPFDWFQGYKTYLAAGAWLVLGIYEYSNGNAAQAMTYFAAAASLVGLRSAVAKLEK